MKDIILINPNYLEFRGLSITHLTIQRYPPLGLAYLTSFLVKEGFDVGIIDAAALNITNEKIVELLKKNEPKFVGIYTTSLFLPIVYGLIQKIKDKTNCTVIIGGPHVTYYPQSIIRLGADYGIRGDGEIPLLELLRGKNKTEIPGLIYLKNKKLKINNIFIYPKLDELPFPARYMLPNEKYFSPLFPGKMTTMITSKGCNFNCIFCGIPHLKSYAEMSVGRVIQEIEQIVHNDFEYIEIEDDCFTLNKKRVQKICEKIIQNKFEINWGAETRADMVDQQLMLKMKKAGCTNIRFGIESGCERVRNSVINKFIPNSTIKKAIRSAKKAGLEVVTYFMFGHPTETMNEMKKTLEFALQLNQDYADFHLAIPIPGSRLFEIACEEGKLGKDIWDKVIFSGEIPTYVPDNISIEEMLKLQQEAYLKFYFSIRTIGKFLFKVKNMNDFKSKIKTAVVVFKKVFKK